MNKYTFSIFILLLTTLILFCSCNSEKDCPDDCSCSDGDAELVLEDEIETEAEPEAEIEPEVELIVEEEMEPEAEDEPEIELEPEPEVEPEMEAEEEWIDPGYDQYRGSLAYQTKATGWFRVEKIGERYWLVTPEGHPFFSTGFCGVKFEGTATYDGQYHYRDAVTAKYGTVEAWADAQIVRLDEWGWNTVGAWSNYEQFKGRFPYAVIVYTSQTNWADYNPVDFFEESWAQWIIDNLPNMVAPYKDDPYLIGFFLDNEMHWGLDWHVEAGHLLRDYMAMTYETSAGKRYLIEWLRLRYITMEHLKNDFTLDAGIETWEDMRNNMNITKRNTSGSYATRQMWTGEVAERFFGVTDSVFRAADPHHLNLGVRFVSQLTPTAVLNVAGRYVDIMTVNWYDLNGNLADNLSSWDPDYCKVDNDLECHWLEGGKPIIVSEWSFRAADSGLPNSYPPFYPTLAIQKERADAYEDRFRRMLSKPWFVGHHWFIYVDQPPEGRFDGEDNNFGIVTEADEPYTELAERSAMMHGEIYKLLPPQPEETEE